MRELEKAAEVIVLGEQEAARRWKENEEEEAAPSELANWNAQITSPDAENVAESTVVD